MTEAGSPAANEDGAVQPCPRDGTALVGALRLRADRKLREVLQGETRCALLGFPRYRNVGDSLIWLGELDALRRVGVRIAYASDERAFDADRLVRRLPRGPILLTGGGNFGDLWPKRQAFREHVVQRFPDREIVQLPQSLWFGDAEALARARRIFAGHRRLTLLARDDASLAIAQEQLGVEAQLCPDMAFGIHPLPSRPEPECDVVWLARTDREARHGTERVPDGVPVFDWVEHERDASFRLTRRLWRWVGSRRPLSESLARMLPAAYARVARHRMDYGVALLGRGRAVVSDRLHGYLLCLLLGIPHVILDNSSGKVFAFHRRWTADSGLTHVAQGPEQALEMARGLAERSRAGVAGGGAPVGT